MDRVTWRIFVIPFRNKKVSQIVNKSTLHNNKKRCHTPENNIHEKRNKVKYTERVTGIYVCNPVFCFY